MATYTEKKRLGGGGFGDVYRCVRDVDGQVLAKKNLKKNASPKIIARFVKEVRILESLDHPNIVKVLGKRLQKPPYYFIMPLYKKSMADEVESLIGDADRIQKVFGAILDAIEFAHSEGIIHRDLKPANVLMNSDDDVVVSDFGLGRFLNSTSTRKTVTGVRMGTEPYAAPEQWSNAKSADERADIFSLGRILYELHSDPLVSAHQDTAKIDPATALIIDRCTAQKPSKRFQTVAELKETWLMVTGRAAGLAPSEEATQIIAELAARRSFEKEEVERLIEILTTVLDDGDFIHEVVMKLPAPVVAEMSSINVRVARQLMRQFVDHTSSQGWPFSYTDKIGNKCQALYKSISDPTIRADLLLCVLRVGTDHGRWHVQEIFDDLMKESRDAGENLALYERLNEVLPHLRATFAKKVPAARLTAKIKALLKEDEQEPPPWKRGS